MYVVYWRYIIYYTILIIPSIHNIHQDKIQQLHLGYIWLHVSAVAKYNLIVIIASCLDVCRVLTVHNILYKFDNTQRDGLSQI